MLKHFIQTLWDNKLRFYQGLSLLLAITTLIMAGAIFFYARPSQEKQKDFSAEDTDRSTKDIPFYNEIMSIVEPLQYSGLQALLRKDVVLGVDFVTHTWSLKSIHRFDKEGNILLDEGRYGLCGELASFTYPKIRSILGPEYDVKFIQVAESGFFLQPQSSHIALQIKNRNTSEVFLLDPSLHRYKRLEDCNNYFFYNYHDILDFVANRTKDVRFDIDSGTPIFIRKDMILFLTVEDNEGQFDEENFSIAITATQRYQYAGRYVLLMTRKEGKINVFENPLLIKELFTMDIYEGLRRKIFSWVAEQH